MRNEYGFKKGKRGAVLPAPAGKTRITIRLDDDILNDRPRSEIKAKPGDFQHLRAVATFLATAILRRMQR